MASATATRRYLPAELTSFIGRRRTADIGRRWQSAAI